MVRVRINGVQYKVCTQWDEVDTDKLFQCETFRDELKALTTIPANVIDRATEMQLWPLYTCVSFIDDLDTMPFLEALNVEAARYEQLELAKTFLQTGKPYRKIIGAARVYYPEEKNPVRLIGLGVSVVTQIAVFLKNYEEMATPPDSQEVSAGVESLGAFGAWGTVFNLAGRDLLKVREIFAKPAIEVYTALLFTYREAEYQKKLFELRHPKK
jgi:hypothetical protein